MTHHTRGLSPAGEHQEGRTRTCSLKERDNRKLETVEDETGSAEEERLAS